MRIVTETIPEDGVVVDVQLDTSWAVDVASTVLEVSPDRLEGSLQVRRRGRLVEVRGEIEAVGMRECERCGVQTPLTLGGEVDLAYTPQDDAPTGHAEIRLAPGDLDIGWYSGGVLDMADVLSEALALSQSPRIQCTDTAACDARVAAMLEAANVGAAPSSDSPFAALLNRT